MGSPASSVPVTWLGSWRKHTAPVDISIISPVDYMLYTYSGTELAVQLRALADSAAKQMNFDPSDVRFLLLDLADQVMPEVGEKRGAAAQRVLKSRGIDVRLGITLKEVHADHVVLGDDSLIRTHTAAWVTGVTGAPLIDKLGLPTEKGRLTVQADLQVAERGHPDAQAPVNNSSLRYVRPCA
ncbi:MAG: hypothetical protein NVSMB60_30900 [Mycobacterium sp.]